eukprot:TRINITY_DN20934_c0_g1_i1.p1 TRINITY_DN20934_c0_g1~~TRINITY_DN20934_c0_g1_i1.p1  ORF type:complete len:117 (-),score=1.57 TRINITY_DN20934_c0_g1_i1:483-833(-)
MACPVCYIPPVIASLSAGGAGASAGQSPHMQFASGVSFLLSGALSFFLSHRYFKALSPCCRRRTRSLARPIVAASFGMVCCAYGTYGLMRWHRQQHLAPAIIGMPEDSADKPSPAL